VQLIAKEHGHQYITLDDPAQLAAAKEDSIGFVGRLKTRVVLDEIQRSPELFLPIKMSVDTNRDPGRFILTGSANLLQIPDLPDSLAGRIEIMRLGPLTQLELARCVEGSTLLERIFQPMQLGTDRVDRLGEDLIHRPTESIDWERI